MCPAIPRDLGDGGAHLGPNDGVTGDPTLLELLDGVADDLAGLRPGGALNDDSVIYGLTGSAPSTPNSQAAGTGNTTWRANVAAGGAIVDGVEKIETAQADFAIHSGSMLVNINQSCIARIVEKNVGGTVTTAVVKGAAAATGAQVAPTDAEVSASLSTASSWVELFRVTLARDGGVNLTAVVSHRYRGSCPVALATTKATS